MHFGWSRWWRFEGLLIFLLVYRILLILKNSKLSSFFWKQKLVTSFIVTPFYPSIISHFRKSGILLNVSSRQTRQNAKIVRRITVLTRFVVENAVVDLKPSQFCDAFDDPPKNVVWMLLVFIEVLLNFTLTHRLFCRNQQYKDSLFWKTDTKRFCSTSSYLSINRHIPRIAVRALSEVIISKSTFQYISNFKESCPVSVLCHYRQRWLKLFLTPLCMLKLNFSLLFNTNSGIFCFLQSHFSKFSNCHLSMLKYGSSS